MFMGEEEVVEGRWTPCHRWFDTQHPSTAFPFWESTMTRAEAFTKPLVFFVNGDGCFVVTSHRLDANGYARCTRQGITYFTHRWIWQECFGEIQDGIEVCHRCDNPSCINPEHLFLGTQADNIRDCVRKMRHSFGEKNHFAVLTSNEVREIRKMRSSYGKKRNPFNHTTQKVAKEYGISRQQVNRIMSGETWRSVV